MKFNDYSSKLFDDIAAWRGSLEVVQCEVCNR